MKAVIYARFSSDNQRTESIDAQIRYLNDFAKDKYTIVNTYIDEALTATNDDRPNFQQMIHDSRKGLFDVVLVHKLDRFARNRYDSAFYKKELEKHGVKVVSALENFDDSPESIILEAVIEGMNEYYSANLSREVKKGMNENALQCKHNGGIPPLGYDVMEDMTYIINPYEAEIVKKIFKLYLSGLGYGEILKELKNYTTKRGNKFCKRSIMAILKNEKYTGTYVFGKYKRKIIDGRKVDIPNENVTRIENGMPVIISKEDYNMAMEKMKENQEEFRTYNKKENYLLTGKIFCSCGSRMGGNSRHAGRNKELYVTYDCLDRKRKKNCSQKGINRDLVEQIVMDKIESEIMLNIDAIVDRVYKYQMNEKTSLNSQLETLSNDLKQVNSEIDNIISAIARGMYHDSLKSKLSELESQKENYMSMIYKIQTSNEMTLNKNNIKAFLLSHRGIKEKPYTSQKAIIDTFVKYVEVNEDKVSVTLIVDVGHGGEGLCITSTTTLASYRHSTKYTLLSK